MALFDIISVVLLADPNIFLCIPSSAADAPSVSPKGINRLLANGVIHFPSMVILFLIKDQVIYFLTVSFLIIELLKI